LWEAAQTGIPIMRPLLLEYPDDPTAIQQNDEYLFGRDLLIAPVTKDDDLRREVYLPRGVWYDFWTDRRATGPQTITVDAPLERIPVFVRGGAIVPGQQLTQYAGQAPIDPLIFDIYPDMQSSTTYYEDDGISYDYLRGLSLRQRLGVAQLPDGLSIEVSAREGLYTPPARSLVFKIHAQRTQPRQVVVGGRELASQSSLEALEHATEAWVFDASTNIVWLKTPDPGLALKVLIR